MLETAEPATKVGLNTFYSLHDTLVKAPLYKRAVDGTASTFSLAASTTAYKCVERSKPSIVFIG